MHRIFRKLLPALTVAAVIAVVGCTPPAPGMTRVNVTGISRPVTVERGNLDITVSVDGNLNMPQAFNLNFGAPGNVLNVNVKEGDHVKAGTVLAQLDDTSQALAIKQANNKVQGDLANLYDVPRLPQFRTTFYDANLSQGLTAAGVPIWETVSDITTVSTVLTPLGTTPVPISSGPTPVTTSQTTGDTTGFTRVTTTVTAVPGYDPPNTTQVTTQKVTETRTVQTIQKPRFDFKFDNDPSSPTYHQFIGDPNLRGASLSAGYPSYYPTGTILDGYTWYQQELSTAQQLFLSENYTGASSELYVAQADLESIVIMIQDAINNPQSGLGNTAPSVTDENAYQLLGQGQDVGAVVYILALRKDVDQITQAEADIQKTRDLIAQKKYDEAAAQLQVALSGIEPIGKIVYTNYNIINVRNDTTVYGKDLSLKLYSLAEAKLNEARAGLEKDGTDSPDLETNLRIAEHYMMLSNAILGTNDYVLQHGLSMKNQAQYNINLANDLVALKDRNNDFIKTVILAPFDGIVVAVNLKINDVLSQIDYASKGNIQMVDTSQIEFKGLVDEIDIIKISTGQKATVSVDAVSNKTFTGKVAFISPFGAADTSGVVKFKVTVLLDPTDFDLKGGLTATADVAISSVENALTIPIAAVTTTAEGSFVNVPGASGQTEKRKITTGAQNQRSVQVLTGLNEGDKIILEEKAAGAPIVTRMGPPGGGGPPPGR